MAGDRSATTAFYIAIASLTFVEMLASDRGYDGNMPKQTCAAAIVSTSPSIGTRPRN